MGSIKYNTKWNTLWRFRLMGTTMLALLVLGIFMIAALNSIYQERIDVEYAKRGQTVAREAAYLLDGETIDRYLAAPEKDEQYAAILAHLDMLRVENGVKYLYVQRIVEGGAVFVWDTDPQAPVGLGEFDAWDESYDPVVEPLHRGERVAAVALDTKWGHLLVSFEPVFRADGSVAGYVGVNIAMDTIIQEQNALRMSFSAVVATVFLVVFAVNLYITQKENAREVKRQSRERAELTLKSILDGMEAQICVCDCDTFEVLFLNDAIRANFGITRDVAGQHCYKILQGLDEPCEVCPYWQLRENPDQIITWEHQERIKGSVLRKTARLISWPDGRKGHLEYAIDITELKKTQKTLEERDKILEALNRAAIILLAQSEESFAQTMAAGVKLVANIAGFDRMSIFRNLEKPDGLYLSQVYRWDKMQGGSTDTLQALLEVAYASIVPRWEGILASGECIHGMVSLMPEAESLKQFGCQMIFAAPVFNNDVFWGFVFFENHDNEQAFTEEAIDMLHSASLMLANMVIRHDERAEIEYQTELLYTLNRASAILLQSSSETFEKDLLRAMGILAKTAEADRAYIWQNHIKNGVLYCSQIYEWSEAAEPQQGKDLVEEVLYREAVPEWEEIFLRRQCVNRLVRELPPISRALLGVQGILSILAVPIFVKEGFWGFVGFDNCHSERLFSEKEEAILRSASELIADALIRNHMERNIRHLETEVDKIYYDGLTGIYNRRYFDENMKRIFSLLSRSGGLCSVMMVDIDYFKRYNDTYGHSEGDVCLKAVARTLSASITRKDDFVARYGGEEFVVVLPNTNEEGARLIAGKMLENIRKCAIPHENNAAAKCVTVSIGAVTGKAEYTASADVYIQRADELLYQSKHNGRNQYTFAWI